MAHISNRRQEIASHHRGMQAFGRFDADINTGCGVQRPQPKADPPTHGNWHSMDLVRTLLVQSVWTVGKTTNLLTFFMKEVGIALLVVVEMG